MKKIIFIFFNLFLIGVKSSPAQNFDWKFVNPNTTTENIINFTIPDFNTFLGLVNPLSYFIKTNDGGKNWNTINFTNNPSKSTGGFYFINANTGFFVTDSIPTPYTIVMKTTNQGLNWFSSFSFALFDGYPLRNIKFNNNGLTGFICGNRNMMMGTINGGQSWFNETYPFNPKTLNDVEILSNIFIVVGDSNTIRSRNISGGIVSEYPQIFSTSTNYVGIKFVNENTGFIIGNLGRIIKTTNKGVNWSISYNESSAGNLRSIDFADENTGIVSGNGFILRTTNGGVNWTQILLPVNIIMYKVKFYNSNIAYISGQNGYIFKSTNGGLNWFEYSKHHFTNKLLYSCFPNEDVGYIVTENSKIFKTTNRGQSFDSQSSGSNVNLTKVISFPNNPNLAYICGDNGLFLRTINGGINWTSQALGINDPKISMDFVDVYNGFAGGSLGGFAKTTNGGESWTKIPTLINSFQEIDFVNETTGWARTDEMFPSKIWKTTNGGNNWIQYALGGLQMLDVKFNNPLEGIYVVLSTCSFCPYYSALNRTTNDGLNWSSFNYNGTIIDVTGSTFNSNLYWAVSGTVLNTTNGGVNWMINRAITNTQLTSINYIDNSNNISVTGNNGLLLLGNQTQTSITPISTEINNSYILNQNYPNPFNPNTKISFSIPQSEFVQLKIYNLIGEEVETLVNENLTAGEYEVDWSGFNYSSGVYFYKIISGNYSKTKKMVLIK